jgi:hypothetical protein
MKAVSRFMGMAALATAAAFAQHAPPDPATMAQHRVTQLTGQLGLTGAQAAQATTIYTNSATAVAPLQSQMRTLQTAMQAAVKSGAADTIEQTAAQMGTLMGQITAIQSKADAAFYAGLSTSQQTAANAIPGVLGGGPHGPGGPGGGGPPPGPPPSEQ